MTSAASPKGSLGVASALQDVTVEKVVGTTASENSVKLSSLWGEQVSCHVLQMPGADPHAAEVRVTPVPGWSSGPLQSHSHPAVARHSHRCSWFQVAHAPCHRHRRLEPLGLEEFVDGNFWDGELFLDSKKAAYHALALRSTGVVGALRMLGFNRAVKDSLARTKAVPGNLKGDGLQLGATLLLDKGGAVLLDYRQQHFADHPSPAAVLEAFGLDPALLHPPASSAAGAGASASAVEEPPLPKYYCAN
eukprot:jgi/Mesen1/9012/ME000563S08323